MKITSRRRWPALVLALLALPLGLAAVRAGFAQNLTVSLIDAEHFPRIQLALEGAGLDQVRARHFSIQEQGEENHGPIAFLPPKAPSQKVDLFVLLDHSGNTRPYQDVIRANLKALAEAMQADGVDLKVHLTRFGAGDGPQEEAPEEMSQPAELFQKLQSLGFDELRLNHAYGLGKLYSLASFPARPGAEKVALLLNGSPFYQQEKQPEATTYTLADTIGELAQSGFVVFAVGAPVRALHALKSDSTEEASLTHSLPGGYLGGYGADLLSAHQMLKSRTAQKGVLQYYSNLPPSETGLVELYASGELASTFSYPALDRSAPVYFTHMPPAELEWGNPFQGGILVQASHRLIEALEFYYLKPDQSVAVLPLVRQPQKDQAGQRWYQAEVPPKDSPQDFFRYALLAHSPLGPAGDVNDFITVPILSYDKGIALESTIVNGDSILWRWNGPTVAMGSKFQLWAGDEMLAETVEDHVIVPAGACQKYQIVQLKVRVNPGADHPYAGQWSLPSAPFEAYAGQDGPIHEKEGIELMLSCLEQKALASLNQVVQGESLYQAGHDLYLEKALYYLSKIVWPQQAAQIDFGNYRFLYSILRFVSDQESQDYAKSTDKLPRSLLHKLVFQFNHGQNLDERFADSLQEMSLRMKGHPSI